MTTVATRADIQSSASYSELSQMIAGAGLLRLQPAYYVMKFATTGLLLALAVFVLAQGTSIPWWTHLLNAAFLAFVFGQIGLLGHDVGHRQVFRSQFLTTACGMLLGNLLLGLGVSWWRWSHDTHHAHPNHVGLDPAVDFAVLAFTPGQARSKPAHLRWVIRHQATLVVPLACFELMNLHVETLDYLWRHRRSRPASGALEAGLVVIHAAAYLCLAFLVLGPALGSVFVCVHYPLSGLYLASLFAPNHKGMPMVDDATDWDALHRQVLTARNMRGGALVDFWYGGLNRQIEHHLFPSMPRNRLRRSAPIVRAYCEEHGLNYHETSVAESYRELFSDFRRIGHSLG